jgi:hypothetical protein
MPAWAKERAVKGLMGFWLMEWDGARVANLDRLRGGFPIVLRQPFRRCEVCNRPIIGGEAIDRRNQVESCVGGRELPCRDQCLAERDLGLWTRLSEVKAA